MVAYPSIVRSVTTTSVLPQKWRRRARRCFNTSPLQRVSFNPFSQWLNADFGSACQDSRGIASIDEADRQPEFSDPRAACCWPSFPLASVSFSHDAPLSRNRRILFRKSFDGTRTYEIDVIDEFEYFLPISNLIIICNCLVRALEAWYFQR